MADAVLVVLLLAFIWAAVLVPPAAGARAAREAEFLGSIRPGGHPHDPVPGSDEPAAVDEPRFRPGLTANARRRQVLGGLVVAAGITLVLGLLPMFHLLLVVHLFLVNSCLAYVGLLVHMRDENAAITATRADSTAAWRRDPVEPRTAAHFGETVHPYAYGSAGFEYPDELGVLRGEAEEYAEAVAAADGYAYQGAFESPDAYEDDTRYAGYEPDYEAEAAYVDEELALRTA